MKIFIPLWEIYIFFQDFFFKIFSLSLAFCNLTMINRGIWPFNGLCCLGFFFLNRRIHIFDQFCKILSYYFFVYCLPTPHSLCFLPLEPWLVLCGTFSLHPLSFLNRVLHIFVSLSCALYNFFRFIFEFTYSFFSCVYFAFQPFHRYFNLYYILHF